MNKINKKKLGEIFSFFFFLSLFFWHKRNINDNFKYQVQYQRGKINKLKSRVIYRPRFSCGIDHGWTSDYVVADVAIGDDMVMLMTWRPVA
jgi:hypothetical protein